MSPEVKQRAIKRSEILPEEKYDVQFPLRLGLLVRGRAVRRLSEVGSELGLDLQMVETRRGILGSTFSVSISGTGGQISELMTMPLFDRVKMSLEE